MVHSISLAQCWRTHLHVQHVDDTDCKHGKGLVEPTLPHPVKDTSTRIQFKDGSRTTHP